MTELSPQQDEALAAIAHWYATDPADPFRLFGPAGTGKTTLAKSVAAALDLDPAEVQFAAYTGKAAGVLRRKGCEPAGTLHSLIYKPVSNDKAKARLAAAYAELDALAAGWASGLELAGALDKIQEEISDLEAQVATIGFVINPASELAGKALLILDEVSMVDKALAADLESFGVPILVLGDPEQLEPIGGEGHYTAGAAAYALTEIHRQALNSPVLELANRIRVSRDEDLGMTEADLTTHDAGLAMEHDQILCWKNATRWAAIGVIRAKLGRAPGEVVAGDRIMCLTNNKDMSVFNGQQFDVVADALGVPSGALAVTVRDEAGDERMIKVSPEGFGGRERQDTAKRQYVGGRGDTGLFTYANAITVHKAQGSEWGSVYVVNESRALVGMTASRTTRSRALLAGRRWAYTAVTRAAESVTITKPRG